MRLKQLTSGSLTVLLVTIFNRGTGYLRDLLMTAALGATPASQIFVFAFRVFGMVRALTAESAIPSIVIDRYVHQYSRFRASHDRAFFITAIDREWGSWWLLCVLWALLLAIANPFLMAMLLPSEVFTMLSSSVIFIISFSLIFGIGLSTTSVSAIYPSLFQAQGRFFTHSALAAVLNIVYIGIFLIVLVLRIDDLVLLALQIAVALVIAGLFQIVISRIIFGQTLVAIMWPFGMSAPHRTHFRLALDSLTKMVPISIFNATSPLAAILATLILVRYDLNITYFFVAERLVQLIPGTVGYAIGIVILPMSARARYDKAGDLTQTVFLISILLLVGFIIAALLHQFSYHIVSLLYHRFEFTANDAATTAVFLIGIAVSVPALLIEPVLSNRLFGQMCVWANVILVVGSIAVCVFGWLGSEWLGSFVGGTRTGEACAVFNFIVISRAVLLIILNFGVSEHLKSPIGDP